MQRVETPLKKEFDKILQQKGRERYQRCEVCGQPISCLHHFHPKSVSNALRYDWDNLIPICNGCHSRHHQMGDPIIHGAIIKKRGQDWYDKLLVRRYRETVKTNKVYYERIKQNLLLENNWESKYTY